MNVYTIGRFERDVAGARARDLVKDRHWSAHSYMVKMVVDEHKRPPMYVVIRYCLETRSITWCYKSASTNVTVREASDTSSYAIIVQEASGTLP